MPSMPPPDFLEKLVALSLRGDEAQKKILEEVHNRFPSVGALLCAEASKWDAFTGQAELLHVLCKLLREIAHRYTYALLPEGDLLEQSSLLKDYLMARMAREKVEQFRILFLDKNNHLILDELQGRGTINHAPVYPREVAKRCIELQATSLIMVHNHPAGQITPSKGDVITTQKIEAALQVIGVRVADHYIITRAAQTSFRQLGLLLEL